MTVTYVERNIGTTKVDYPVLHKIVWHIKDLHRPTMSPTWANPKFREVDDWLKDNCKHPYYHGPAWDIESFIEFECDEDAMLFTLRWL